MKTLYTNYSGDASFLHLAGNIMFRHPTAHADIIPEDFETQLLVDPKSPGNSDGAFWIHLW